MCSAYTLKPLFAYIFVRKICKHFIVHTYNILQSNTTYYSSNPTNQIERNVYVPCIQCTDTIVSVVYVNIMVIVCIEVDIGRHTHTIASFSFIYYYYFSLCSVLITNRTKSYGKYFILHISILYKKKHL